MTSNLLKYEKELYKQGYKLIAGVDEAGRGPLCGPVVAAAVILPINYKLEGLNDSKQLSAKKREKFFAILIYFVHIYTIAEFVLWLMLIYILLHLLYLL